MYTLYVDDQRHYGSEVATHHFYTVQKKIAEDVNTAVLYYRGRNFAVRTEHLLCNLIRTMNVPLAYEIDRYYDAAVARAPFIANQFQLTSSLSPGKWFKNQFYHGCEEVLLSYHEEGTPRKLLEGWEELDSVRPLTTPVSNLSYMLPTGTEHNSETGLAVVGINLPWLMVQYYGFNQLQRRRWVEGQSTLGVEHFVAKYVIPNMLYRQTDLAIEKRLINIFNGAPMGKSSKKHPFYISDYADKLDRGLEELLERFKTLKMDYRTLLAQIPSVFNTSVYKMPDMAETRQVWWALFLARFELTQFLWEVGGAELRHINQRHLNELIIDLRRFGRENVLKNRATEALYQDIMLFEKRVKANT